MKKKKVPYMKPLLKLIPLGSQEYDQYIHALHMEQKQQEEHTRNMVPAELPQKDTRKKQSDG